MHQIKNNVGHVVAADAQNAVKSVDDSIVQQSRMCASVIEAAHDSNLPTATTQPILEAIAAGMHDALAARAKVDKAVRGLAAVQARSNLRETSFGCPNGPYIGRANVFAKSVEPAE